MDRKYKKRNFCLEEKIPKGIIKRDSRGEFIPYCNGRPEGVIQNYRGCEKEKCKFYEKKYFKK